MMPMTRRSTLTSTISSSDLELSDHGAVVAECPGRFIIHCRARDERVRQSATNEHVVVLPRIAVCLVVVAVCLDMAAIRRRAAGAPDQWPTIGRKTCGDALG